MANPDWRLVGLALALEAVAFTFLLLRAVGGWPAVRTYAFPVLFFLVAVPWPTPFEQPIVQTLTRANVAVTLEILHGLGIAAVPHGNVIETARGYVDIDTACSGIRSLQASLMIALFFGEWKRFAAGPRLALAAVGLGLAMLFNAGRTVLLSYVTAQDGPEAMARWHDPAGIIILVACFTGIWLLSEWLEKAENRKRRTESAAPPAPAPSPSPTLNVECSTSNVRSSPSASTAHRPLPTPLTPALLLFTFLLASELAIRAWYRSAAPAPSPAWHVSLPTKAADFAALDLPRETVRMLRFTEGHSARWRDADGAQWQFFYFRWAPGRTAVNLARNHTPEICLPAAGHTLVALNDITTVSLGAKEVPFRAFIAGSRERPLYVFYTLWEDGALQQHARSQHLTMASRLQAVRDRRRNPGQRVIEVAISGVPNLAAAETSLREQLPKLIQVSRDPEMLKR